MKKYDFFWQKFHGTYKGDITARIVIKRTKNFIGKQILDAGAGSGSFVQELRRFFPGSKIIGIDLSPKSKLVQKGDITQLSFKDNSFDTILCTDVLEHLTPQQTKLAVKEMSRVCRPNGHLIISTLNEENLNERTALCPDCRKKFHIWGHQQSFSVKSLVKLFRRVGFNKVKVELLHLTYIATRPLFSSLIYIFGLDKLVFKLFKSKKFQKDILMILEKP